MLILHLEATIICEEFFLMLMVIRSYWMYIPNDEKGKKEGRKTLNKCQQIKGEVPILQKIRLSRREVFLEP